MRKASRKRPTRPRRDWGRGVAFAFCVFFAVIGTIPLGLGALVRTSAVRGWAARETAALLERELGLSASYSVRVQAWPLLVALEDVTVEATDGGSPFLEVERIAVRPRLFSLLAGHLDAGDIEILGPRARVVVRGGALQNVTLRTPESSGESKPLERAPFSSIAVTDLDLDLDIDGLRARTRELDLDVSAEGGMTFEIALRAGLSSVARTHPVPGREGFEDAVDEDIICRFDTRVRVEPGSVLVRRLTLQGSTDLDPDPGTMPSCALPAGDWRAVDVELGALRVAGIGEGLPSHASGRVRARVPAPLVHRFLDLPHLTGAIMLDVEAEYEAGARLPRVEGTLQAEQIGLDGKVFFSLLKAKVAVGGDTVRLNEVEAHWADGRILFDWAELRPFAEGIPLTTSEITVDDVDLAGLLRDLGTHPQPHVGWLLDEGGFEYLNGTLNPLDLEGPLDLQTRSFGVYDRPTPDPDRRRMIGVSEARVRGDFQIKPDAVVLSDFAVDTPRSHIGTTVSLGFGGVLAIDVYPGSRVDLADISPLVETLELGGMVSLHASVRGPFEHPKTTGEVSIERFVFSGFPVGELEPTPVTFEPLVLTLENARIRHGQSRARASRLRIDFDAGDGASVVLDGEVDTHEAPHLGLRDMLEIFRFDKDPRFAEYDGVIDAGARVHYALGGREDRCGGGLLDVHAGARLTKMKLLGERFDDGEVELDMRWDDQEAGSDGMRIDVRSAALRKGGGSILATASVRHRGALQGSIIASGIPLSSLDALGSLGAGADAAAAAPRASGAPPTPRPDGSVSLVATLGGTVSRMEGLADVHVSRVRIGPSSLPASRLNVAIRPDPSPPRVVSRTRCGNPVGPPFDLAEHQKDLPSGEFQVSGELFGGQIRMDEVRITRQERKVVSGRARVEALDLGTLANLIPGVAFTSAPPKGTLTASLDIARLPIDDMRRAELSLIIDALEVEREGQRVRLTRPSGTIRLEENAVKVPELRMEFSSPSGLTAAFKAGGAVRKTMTAPELDLVVEVEPTSLARLSADIESIQRASGTLQARLEVTGPLTSLRYAGLAELKDGELDLEGLPVPLEDIDVVTTIGGGEARLKASARLGTGTIAATGRMPLRGLTFGTAQAAVVARGVKLPVTEGVNLAADADLEVSFRPSFGDEAAGSEQNLPDVRGSIALTSFSYTRPIAMSVDLGQLTGRRRTEVETYDPAKDVVRFYVTVVSPKPLRFSNNLVDMRLEVDPGGLALSGTNQRFGARGSLRILPGSTLTLRTTEFDVREGLVSFNDPYRIAPKVDVRAETEYRRYASATADTPSEGGGSAAGAGSAAANTSGQWRIKMHAHGDAENLRLGLTSDPQLSQEDIVLLLTLGMTRAEVDRGLASSLGETVGLEALSTLTGADKAVKTMVPIIDEFRFGSGYSSRTGRPEPTVTVGKRITDGVRANVTTGLTENREVRSSVEWRLNQRMSVQGSYDNANDASSSQLGNLGADLRWRLEFE